MEESSRKRRFADLVAVDELEALGQDDHDRAWVASPQLSSPAGSSSSQPRSQIKRPSTAASSSATTAGRNRLSLPVTPPPPTVLRNPTCPGAPSMTTDQLGSVSTRRLKVLQFLSERGYPVPSRTNKAIKIKKEPADDDKNPRSGVIEAPGNQAEVIEILGSQEQEPTVSQANKEAQKTQPTCRIINIHSDLGEGLVINFRYYSSSVEPVDDIPQVSALNAPFLRLRVSRVALSMASKQCLRPILTGNPRLNTYQRLRSSESRKESWTWLNQESPETYTLLILAAKHPRIPRALIHLADILHFNYSTLQYAPLPSVMVTAAEAGLIVGALGAVMPWVSAWIGEYKKADRWPNFNCPAAGGIQYPWPEEAGPGEMMLLSMIMGDSGKFRRCSRNYIEELIPKERQLEDSFSYTSLGLVRLIENDVQKERKALIKSLIAGINRTFVDFCSVGTSLQKLQTTQMSGALVQSIMSMWKASFPVPDTWQGSIKELMTRIHRIHQDLIKAWEQVCPRTDQNMGPPGLFAKKMQKIRDDMKGLELDKYRPGCIQVMDIESGTLVAGGGLAVLPDREDISDDDDNMQG